VTDNQAERRHEATQSLGCTAHPDLASLLKNNEVELVVIASPSHLHGAQVIEALGRGKHVVCEKPMALSVAEADRMIAAAESAGRILTVFNNMRYWPDFRKVKEIIDSGRLGRIVQVKITLHRFTRRWDWQTMREFGGGALFNAGAHVVDLAMQLLGDAEPMVTADLQRTLSSGDAEDHAKVLLRAVNAPTIEVEISNACAYPQETWHVMGTSGGLHGTSKELQWKWLDFSALPERPLDRSTAATDRRFNSEELPWQEQSWQMRPQERLDYEEFYQDLYESVRNGASLSITPQSVRRTLAVLEQCHRAAHAEPSPSQFS